MKQYVNECNFKVVGEEGCHRNLPLIKKCLVFAIVAILDIGVVFLKVYGENGDETLHDNSFD
jgi:hypothetical protein